MGTAAIIALMTSIVSAMVTVFATNKTSQDQMDLLESQQDFNSEEAEIARQFTSEPQRYERMTTQLGFNPDLASASIMGSPQNSSFAASSPAAPQIPNLGLNLSGLLSGLPQDMLTSMMQPYEIEQMQANTNKTNMEIDWMPLTYEAQISMWDSYASEAKSKAFLNNGPLYDLYKNQADYVVPLSQAQVSVYRSQVTENLANAVLEFQKSLTEDDLRELYNAETKQALSQSFLDGKMSFYYDQLATKTAQDTMVGYAQEDLLKTDNVLRLYEAMSAYYDANVRSLMGGLPWTDDLSKNLFIMEALGGENADWAKMLEDEMFAGMRRLYDNQVQMNMEHYWENFINGLDAGDIVPNLYVPIGGGMQQKTPKGSSYRGGAKPGASRSVSSTNAKGYTRGKPKQTTKVYNGKPYTRIDKYGNHWFGHELVED